MWNVATRWLPVAVDHLYALLAQDHKIQPSLSQSSFLWSGKKQHVRRSGEMGIVAISSMMVLSWGAAVFFWLFVANEVRLPDFLILERITRPHMDGAVVARQCGSITVHHSSIVASRCIRQHGHLANFVCHRTRQHSDFVRKIHQPVSRNRLFF